MGEVEKGLSYVKSPGGLLKLVELVNKIVFDLFYKLVTPT